MLKEKYARFGVFFNQILLTWRWLFLLQLISDAGFQGEITSISTAAQQIEVFSRVLKTTISSFLQNSEDWQNSILECAVSDIEFTLFLHICINRSNLDPCSLEYFFCLRIRKFFLWYEHMCVPVFPK